MCRGKRREMDKGCLYIYVDYVYLYAYGAHLKKTSVDNYLEILTLN